MNDHTLAAEHINAGYNHKTILSDVSVTIPKNKISVILGATADEVYSALAGCACTHRK